MQFMSSPHLHCNSNLERIGMRSEEIVLVALCCHLSKSIGPIIQQNRSTNGGLVEPHRIKALAPRGVRNILIDLLGPEVLPTPLANNTKVLVAELTVAFIDNPIHLVIRVVVLRFPDPHNVGDTRDDCVVRDQRHSATYHDFMSSRTTRLKAESRSSLVSTTYLARFCWTKHGNINCSYVSNNIPRRRLSDQAPM